MAKETERAIERTPPRFAQDLMGQEEAERIFLDARVAGRMPHAWLLVGPRGVGKATFCHHAAAMVLADENGGEGIALPPEHSVRRKVAAGSHPDLVTLDLASGERRSEIPAEDVRNLKAFFSLTPAEGGWRVAIVDSVDELNRYGANALLKIVEEPPECSILFLIAHAPGSVLPTVRSRCRTLRFSKLEIEDAARVLSRSLPEHGEGEIASLASLAEGSPGAALALAEAGGFHLYEEIAKLCSSLPELDMAAVHALGERFSRAPGSDRLPAFLTMFRTWVRRTAMRLVREGDFPEIIAGESAGQLGFARAAGLEGVLSLWDDAGVVSGEVLGLHLDRKQAVLDVMLAARRSAGGS